MKIIWNIDNKLEVGKQGEEQSQSHIHIVKDWCNKIEQLETILLFDLQGENGSWSFEVMYFSKPNIPIR